MLSPRVQPALLAVCAASCLAASARQTPSPAAAPQRPQYYSFNEIHVDQDCRILPDPAHVPPGKKAKPYSDDAICHLETVLESEHVEERIAGTQLLRTKVEIHEHEFVLQDISPDPVTFVVEQEVPKAWTIDSDPQPKQIIGQTAFFPVIVQPGQVVRLHVGMRRDSPLRAKSIAAGPRPRTRLQRTQAFGAERRRIRSRPFPGGRPLNS
jgi:hypothetical protein